MDRFHSKYYRNDGEPVTGFTAVNFYNYQGGHGPVVCLKDMPPEKQKELLELYKQPDYNNRLSKRGEGAGSRV